MSKITEKIKQELLIRCEKSKEKDGYDFWNEHIKYVVENGIELAKKYGADIEIVELGALLHDIAMPSEYGEREQHHIYGAEIAECLTDFEKFINNEEIDTPDLIKIAILHYQFESIHPFLDGNGRIGRLLIPLYIQSKGMLDKSCLYSRNQIFTFQKYTDLFLK